MKYKILVVDDAPEICQMIQHHLKKEGYDLQIAYNAFDAINIVQEENPDLILSDIQMPKKTGIEMMIEIRETHPEMTVIFLTAHGSVESAVEAMKTGAYDYIQKPFTKARLLTTVKKSLENIELKHKYEELKSMVSENVAMHDIVGSSKPMQSLMNSVRKTFNLDTTILILGESGTGKELLAQTIHKNSENRDQSKFVAVNCAALPETLLESELFGYQKGAFTGANTDKIGKFEFANGGTIFLDEIAETSPVTQAKLLRVLQEREVQRIGSNDIIPIDVRVIAATNKDLEEYIREGKFREDLYYRLNVFPLTLPPLRDRLEDLEDLCLFFIEKLNERFKKSPEVKKIAHDALKTLQSYGWPGNVRELQNVMERAMIETSTDEIIADNLPYKVTSGAEHAPIEDVSSGPIDSLDLPKTVEQIERRLINAALKKYNFNLSDVAKALKIGRSTLYRKAEQYEISMEKPKIE